MPDVKLDREALNAIARYAYGSGFFGEGEKGGRGNMGLLKGADGRLRVIKFNTHRGEGGEVTRDQIKASNFLRDQLLTLARNFGKSEEVIQRIRQELGLDQDGNQPPQSLLTRTIVATVVKMIDQDIWQNIKRTDDGRGEFKLSTLKSRSGNMEFNSVKAEKLGLVTDDAVNRSRNTFMSKTVSDAIGKLKQLDIYTAMSPTTAKSFRFVIDETLKLWQESKFSPEVEAQLATSEQPGQEMGSEKKKIKQQLENMVRVNFARMLIISGKADDARTYVLKNAAKGTAWDTFRLLKSICRAQAETLRKDPNLQKCFLLALNRFRKDSRYSWELYHPVGEDGTEDICDPLAEMPNTIGRQYGAAVNYSSDEKKVLKEWEVVDPDLLERQKLWDEVDKLPKELLPKSRIDEVKGAISGYNDQISKEAVKAALDVYKTPIDRQAFVDRLVAAYERVAPEGGGDPRQKLDALLTRLQAVVFSSSLKNPDTRARTLSVEDCVAWIEQNPEFLLRLDRRLNLEPANLDALKEDIRKNVQSQFNDAVDKGKDFGSDSETGVYMPSIREYEEGELTIDGEVIPAVPSEQFVMPRSRTAGTDSCIRKAATETLMTKIDNLAQRKLVSFLLSMIDGLMSTVNDIVSKQKEIPEMLMVQFESGHLAATGNQNKRFCDMTFGKNGSIHLKMTVGCGVQLQQFLGMQLPEKVPLVNDNYEIEITIPKPGEDFKGGCPEFTVDSIKLSDIDTQA